MPVIKFCIKIPQLCGDYGTSGGIKKLAFIFIYWYNINNIKFCDIKFGIASSPSHSLRSFGLLAMTAVIITLKKTYARSFGKTFSF